MVLSVLFLVHAQVSEEHYSSVKINKYSEMIEGGLITDCWFNSLAATISAFINLNLTLFEPVLKLATSGRQ